MPGSGAVWKKAERYKARCLVGACARYTGWGQADALDCNCLNTTSQHRDKQSESTQKHRWCTNTHKHTGRVHKHTNCTQDPLKRHLPAHSRSIHTQTNTNTSCPVQRQRKTPTHSRARPTKTRFEEAHVPWPPC